MCLCRALAEYEHYLHDRHESPMSFAYNASCILHVIRQKENNMSSITFTNALGTELSYHGHLISLDMIKRIDAYQKARTRDFCRVIPSRLVTLYGPSGLVDVMGPVRLFPTICPSTEELYACPSMYAQLGNNSGNFLKCPKVTLTCAQYILNYFIAAKTYLSTQKIYFLATNIYMSARTFIWVREHLFYRSENLFECPKHPLSWCEYFLSAGNIYIIYCRGHFFEVRGNIYLSAWKHSDITVLCCELLARLLKAAARIAHSLAGGQICDDQNVNKQT